MPDLPPPPAQKVQKHGKFAGGGRSEVPVVNDYNWGSLTDEAAPMRRAKPAGVIGAEAIRAAHVSKRFTGFARDRDMPPQPLPHGRGSDQGPPPVDPGELTFLAVDTRAPYTRDFDGPQGGKPAHYMLRRPALDAAARCQGGSSRGEVGPWSARVTATIGT